VLAVQDTDAGSIWTGVPAVTALQPGDIVTVQLL
jgi:hypothetical protein